MVSFLDTESGQVFTAPSEKEQQLSESKIIWNIYDEKVWRVDYEQVWLEFVNYEVPWVRFTMKQCATNFLIALLILLISDFDVYSDYNLAISYINGANYIYYTNYTYGPDTNVNCSNETYNSYIGLYQHTCFIQDQLYGYITLGINFCPGILFSIFLAIEFRKKTKSLLLIIAITPILMIFFIY